MRSVLLIGCIAIAGIARAAPAGAAPVSQPPGWRFGLMLGIPTGFTAKYAPGGADAYDVGVGAGPGLRVHADYLRGVSQVLRDTSDLSLDLYFGGGAAFGLAGGYCAGFYGSRKHFCDEGFFFGGRVPFGLDARLRREPISFGVEVAPVVWFGPDFANVRFDAFLFFRVAP